MAKANRRASRTKSTKKAASRARGSRRAAGAGKSRKTARASRGGAQKTRSARKAATPSPRGAAAAKARGGSRPKPPALQRERRKLTEEEMVPMPPSTLDLKQHRREHTEAGPDLTAGDVDADWEDAYQDGDEAPGGDNPTPDQEVVEEIGRALGVEYDDAEELKGSDKITERDKHRWEYDPASAEDYRDRNKKQ